MKKYIFLSGGLGNQLFQLGAFAKLKELFADVTIDLTALNFPIRGETKRKYELNDYIDAETYAGNLARRYMLEISRKMKATYLSYEELKSDSSWYYGYFQRSEYAAAAKKYMSSMNFVQTVEEKNECAFHFRLGDFLSNQKANQLSGIINDDYIENALQIMSKYKEVHVFSDQPEMAENILKKHESNKYNIKYERRGNSSAWTDIRKLSGYSAVICSNSTFSFWGAYLGRDKEVIAPAKWFANGAPLPEYLPKSWIYI